MRPESFRTITNNKQAWPIKFHTATKMGVKRKSNKDAQNKNNEKYEAYRKRLFLSSWATDRPWLQNDDEKGMTCKICVEHYGPIRG